MSDEQKAKEVISGIVTASHGYGRSAVDGIFAGFLALSKLVHEAGEKKLEARRKRRNERARMRYSINKSLGIPQRKQKAAPEPEREYEAPTSCYCAHTIPPCSWCTDPENDPDRIEESNA